MGYEITMLDDTTESVPEADGYGQEGPLTTFFITEPGRPARLDPWCTRLLSIRTDRVLRIRCAENVASAVRPLSLVQ